MMKNKNTWMPVFILASSPFFIVIVMVSSVIIGTKDISIETIYQAIFHFNESNVDHQIIWNSRIPRFVAALLVGAFLAVAGAIMQGITRNYLASPSIMGVNDGSAFLVTLAIIFLPNMSNASLIIISMIGSAIGAGLVFGFGSIIRDGLSPVRLAIIGTIIGTFLGSVTTSIAMHFQVSQTITLWYNSKIHLVDPKLLLLSAPMGIIGIILAYSLAKGITISSLGEEVAIGLGQKTLWVKIASMFTVVILTGVSVALVGRIGFVGLIIPHITRFLVGVDYRYIIPCAAVIGGCFLALCDVISRLINFPYETPIGVVTAIIGVPFFLYLIWSKGSVKSA